MNYTPVIEAVLQPGIYRATKYVSPTLTIKATRKRFDGKLLTRLKSETVLLTMGRPNWRERKFIKDCEKSDEPFPVRKIQVQQLPRKRRNA